MDAPRPGTQTAVTSEKITYSWQLPCGCTISHECVNRGPRTVGTAEAQEFAEKAQQHLAFWYRDRAPRHRCELVSAENPNGIATRSPQQATS